jgi:hypothetical protein
MHCAVSPRQTDLPPDGRGAIVTCCSRRPPYDGAMIALSLGSRYSGCVAAAPGGWNRAA